VLTTLLSIGLLLTGFYTNFNVDVGKQFSPRNSAPMRQAEFIREHFASKYRYFTVLLHGGSLETEDDPGTNLLGAELVERAFRIIDVVTSVTGYRQLCRDDEITYINPMTGERDCEVYAVTRFWANNETLFEQSTEAEVMQTLSGSFFIDGTPVSRDHLYGTKGQTSTGGTLTTIRSSLVAFLLPSAPGAPQVEHAALAAVLRLRQQWSDQGGPIFLEVQAAVSLNDEFKRAIADDLPLVPVIFAVMSVFTAAAFARWHKVHSRALLGFGAVLTVLLSIAAGFGIMFICGTPFSNLTQILPFIVLYVTSSMIRRKPDH
jgi:Patched family